MVGGANNPCRTNQTRCSGIFHGVEYLAILQLAIGMIEGQRQISHADVLDGFRTLAGFDDGVLYETFIRDEHLEFLLGVFGDVVRRRPTATGKLEERRTAGAFSPDGFSAFVACQSSRRIQLVTRHLGGAEATLFSQFIHGRSGDCQATWQIDLDRRAAFWTG